MDALASVKNAYEFGSELIGDYKRGRQMRLGNYKGVDNTRQLGHYNKSGKRLGIYHG